MTIFIAVPMSFFMAIIVYGTENLGINFLSNLLASGPVAFLVAHFGYNGVKGRFGIGPFAQNVAKFDFPQAMRSMSMKDMLTNPRFWAYGLIVDALLVVEIAVPVSFIKVPWLALNFAPGWVDAWIPALGKTYVLAFVIALVGIILTIKLLKVWMWRPQGPPPT